jgi:hypothetical protein
MAVNTTESILNFDVYSDEIIILINTTMEDSDKLFYSQYGNLYYSWIEINLNPQIKQYTISNLINGTYYVIKYKNVLYNVKTLTEKEEIIRLKLELSTLKANSKNNEHYESVINTYKKQELLNKNIVNKLNKNIKDLWLENSKHKYDLLALKDKNDLISNLKAKINDLENELNMEINSRNRIEDLEYLISSLRDENNELRNKDELANILDENKALRLMVESLENSLNNDKNILVQEKLTLEKTVNTLTNELEDVEYENNKLVIKSNKLHEEISNLKKEREQLNKKINLMLFNGLNNIAQKWA